MALSAAKLVLLALAVLAVRNAEGRLASKCELKNELVAVFQVNQFPGNQSFGNESFGNESFGNQSFGNQSFGNQSFANQSTLDVLAQIVCKVEVTSGFNTSLVTQLAPGNPGTNKPEDGNSDHEKQPPKRRARDARRQQSKGGKSGEKHSESKEEDRGKPGKPGNPTTTPPPTPTVSLYGLFQLSGCVACSNGVTPSSNTCNMSCSALTDDNIHDDAVCFKTVSAGSLKKPEQLPKQCEGVAYATYFSDCP